MVSYRLGYLWAARPRSRGNIKLPVGSRWYCRHQHAFSRYFQLATRNQLLASGRPLSLERPKAGGFRPQPQVVANTNRRLN